MSPWQRPDFVVHATGVAGREQHAKGTSAYSSKLEWDQRDSHHMVRMPSQAFPMLFENRCHQKGSMAVCYRFESNLEGYQSFLKYRNF